MLRKKATKKRKKINEIKINIDNHEILQGKKVTRVFDVESINEIGEMINNITSNVRLKMLINYNLNKFYVFKTENNKKLDLEENELDSSNIAKLIKSFYSVEELQWNDCFTKKSKKIKNEIAPSLFNVSDNYLMTEDRYINVFFAEHLDNNLNIKGNIEDIDCWVSIDCYKVDRNYILNKLDEMKKDCVIEKKFSPFVCNRMDDILNKLEKDIFQCEIKFLLYDFDLDYLNQKNYLIRENLLNNDCTCYMPSEKVNTRKLFEKCIYPNKNMDVIHSITNEELFKMIGCDVDV